MGTVITALCVSVDGLGLVWRIETCLTLLKLVDRSQHREASKIECNSSEDHFISALSQ